MSDHYDLVCCFAGGIEEEKYDVILSPQEARMNVVVLIQFFGGSRNSKKGQFRIVSITEDQSDKLPRIIHAQEFGEIENVSSAHLAILKHPESL